ncbi:MAG: methionine adenosyltransferase domain-containing protein [bacterium]
MQFVEVVTKGQADKICDQIADAVLDEYLRREPNSRVSLEVFGSHGMMVIGGEVTSKADFDVATVAKQVYHEIGYLDEIEPFVNIALDSPDSIRTSERGGANDMCIASGYATNATPQFLPASLVLAQAIAKRLDDLRLTDSSFNWLRPDGKVMVGFDGQHPKFIKIMVQHDDSVDDSMVRTKLFERVVASMLRNLDGVKVDINYSGKITQGGFQVDTGVTGKKLAADTYGGVLPWGAGSLSGKDPSKIDRLSAYMCRFAAKNLVAMGAGRTVMIEAIYSRGEEKPVFLRARTGEGKDLTETVKEKFDFRPASILERLDLRRPIYKATACYGHFGRNEFPWEKLDVK